MFSVHDSVVRVPLIVRYPWGRNRGVVSELVQTHDIFPTVVAVTGGAGADDSLCNVEARAAENEATTRQDAACRLAQAAGRKSIG